MIQKYLPYFIFVYHLLFSWIGWKVLLQKGGDAFGYWFISENTDAIQWSELLSPGTDFVRFFTYPFATYFNLPFWCGFILFSFISGLGFLLLTRLMLKLSGSNSFLQVVSVFLLLLPSLHFWTSIPGKECFLFLFLVILLRNILTARIFSVSSLASIAIIAFIRPHFAAVLLFAVFVALLLFGDLSRKFKILLVFGFVLASGIVAVLLRSILFRFDGFFTTIIRYYESHIRFFRNTESYVPLDEYSLPYKLFTFWFRPLPFEKSGLMYTVIAAENAVLLSFALIALYFFLRRFRNHITSWFSVFSLVFVLAYSLMYVFAYANFGIISRTKILLLPVFYLAVVKVINYTKNTANSMFLFHKK